MDSPSIGRLRARLANQVAAPLVVSTAPQQYVFDEESAAYAEIDVRRGESFVVVIVIGSLPSEQFVVDVWHRYAKEVWLIDTREEALYVARAGEPDRYLARADTLRTTALPGVSIAIDELFALPS